MSKCEGRPIIACKLSLYVLSRYHRECHEMNWLHTGGVGVGGSNPLVPTIKFNRLAIPRLPI